MIVAIGTSLSFYSMQGASVQSGGVGLRRLPHAYWGLLQEQGKTDTKLWAAIIDHVLIENKSQALWSVRISNIWGTNS